MIFGDVLQSYDTDERNLTESIQQLRFCEAASAGVLSGAKIYV